MLPHAGAPAGSPVRAIGNATTTSSATPAVRLSRNSRRPWLAGEVGGQQERDHADAADEQVLQPRVVVRRQRVAHLHRARHTDGLAGQQRHRQQHPEHADDGADQQVGADVEHRGIARVGQVARAGKGSVRSVGTGPRGWPSGTGRPDGNGPHRHHRARARGTTRQGAPRNLIARPQPADRRAAFTGHVDEMQAQQTTGTSGFAVPAYPGEQAPRPPRRRRAVVGALGAFGILGIAAGAVVGVQAAGGGTTTVVGQASPALQPAATGWRGGYGGFGDQGGSGGFSGGSGTGSTGSAAATGTATATQQIGIVDIDTVLGYQNAQAAGTGMVLTSDGEILTNNHVVDGATKHHRHHRQHRRDLHGHGRRHRPDRRRRRAPARRRLRACRPRSSPPAARRSATRSPASATPAAPAAHRRRRGQRHRARTRRSPPPTRAAPTPSS